MARINLLPWREELRKQRQREFGYMLVGGMIITLLLVILAHMIIQGEIDYQNERNNLLRREIAELNKKINAIRELEKVKSSLLSRMEVIQQLQTSRPQIVHLFDEMIRVLPDGVLFTSIGQSGGTISIKGMAQSNARVSALMRSIEKSDWLDKPSLEKIVSKERGKTGLFTFNLKMRQTTPKTGEQN